MKLLLVAYCFPTDVMGTGVWEVLNDLKHQQLKRLATSLQSPMLASRAHSTTTVPSICIGGRIGLMLAVGWLNSLFVRQISDSLYLQHLSETVGSKSTVKGAVNGVGWVHQIAGYPNLAEWSFVLIVLDGLQSNLARPEVHKEPVTSDMLSAVVASHGEVTSLTDVCLVAAFLLAFPAFLHYEEAVMSTPRSMLIHMSSSKTHQCPQGDRVLVAMTVQTAPI